ncbi:MAG: hypothetical protein OEY11_09975 [Gammaproteobacteria bacterium]|nr:hypothetical protein [Gammaproteobacteria bacterium]
MQVLINSLRKTPIFAHLKPQQIKALIQQTTVYTVEAGCKIDAPENAVKHHLLILDGNIKSQNTWLFYGNEMQYCWQIQSDESQCHFAILSSAARAIKAIATSPTRYLFINGDEVENLQTLNHSKSQQASGHIKPPASDLLKIAV